VDGGMRESTRGVADGAKKRWTRLAHLAAFLAARSPDLQMSVRERKECDHAMRGCQFRRTYCEHKRTPGGACLTTHLLLSVVEELVQPSF
jgi:hypothetical protein